jgi:hypothetical protein
LKKIEAAGDITATEMTMACGSPNALARNLFAPDSGASAGVAVDGDTKSGLLAKMIR